MAEWDESQHPRDERGRWANAGGSGDVSGGGKSDGYKTDTTPRYTKEDPIISRKKLESYQNASSARRGRIAINKDLSSRGYKLVKSHPQDGDIYRKHDGAVTKEVRVEPSYGIGNRDAHGNTLHITQNVYERGTKGGSDDEEVPLKTTFPKSKNSVDFARLDGAEIFAAGKWNGLDFSEEDLDRIVQSFEFFELGGRVPLKLGHNDEQPLTDGQPALGWVDRVWRDGGKLKADFRDVPAVVYDAIRNGRYKNVSVELLRDVVAGTRTVPLVLDAVALLGADLPAVGSLMDLQALTMSRLQGAERLVFTQAKMFNPQTGGQKAMAEDDSKLKDELQRLRDDNARIQRDLDASKAQASAATENYSKLQTETRAKEVAGRRKWIIDTLETAVRDKRMLAAARERYIRQFRIETDDEAVMRTPKTDVEQYIKENPNPYIKPASGPLDGNPDAIPVGGLPDVELFTRARKACRDWGKDPQNPMHLKDAAQAVMKADPLLAERYRALPDDHADGKYSA